MNPRRPEPHPHYRLSWTEAARLTWVALAAEHSADGAGAALATATDVEFSRRRGGMPVTGLLMRCRARLGVST